MCELILESQFRFTITILLKIYQRDFIDSMNIIHKNIYNGSAKVARVFKKNNIDINICNLQHFEDW